MSIELVNRGCKAIHIKIDFENGQTANVQLNKGIEKVTLRGVGEGAVALSWGRSTETRKTERIEFEKPITYGMMTSIELVEKSFMMSTFRLGGGGGGGGGGGKPISTRRSKVWPSSENKRATSSSASRGTAADRIDVLKQHFATLYKAVKDSNEREILQSIGALAKAETPSKSELKSTQLGKLIAKICRAKRCSAAVKARAGALISKWKTELRKRKSGDADKTPGQKGKALFKKATTAGIFFELPDGTAIHPSVFYTKKGGGFSC